MIQQTSLDAWHDSQRSAGLKRDNVYREIAKHPGVTDKELAYYLHWPINEVTPRRGELVTRNMVKCIGFRTQNGRTVMSWGLSLK